jgi:hypothetical protein
MSTQEVARRALSTFRIEGELVSRESGGIAVRRGGSIYEVAKEHVLDVQDIEGKQVRVTVPSNAELVRTTVVRSSWFGGALGWRPVFEDCTECCDCTECSVCTDCTECSVCTDCSDFQSLVGVVPSAWIRRFGSRFMRSMWRR